MKKTKFKNIKNKNLSYFTHIIYTHTFTDDQLTYGYDGFVNSLEWLEFTLNILSKNINNRIIVKIHPRVFSNDFKGDTDH